MNSNRLLPGLSLCLAVLLPGCGSNVNRQAVRGTVDGIGSRPGTVTFVPVEGVRAPAARTVLRNGRFEFDDTNGPLPGRYQVRVDVQTPRILNGSAVIVKGVEVPESAVGEVPPEMETFLIEDVLVSENTSAELQLTVQTQD